MDKVESAFNNKAAWFRRLGDHNLNPHHTAVFILGVKGWTDNKMILAVTDDFGDLSPLESSLRY